MRALPRLYLITDRRLRPDLPQAVEAALAALPPGGAAVQLREKDLPARKCWELATALLPICKRHRAPLLVNDRIDVALAAGADGVHLGGGSLSAAIARRLLGPRAWIGVSCHGHDELDAAKGADFATYSPIFPSPGKGEAIGLDALREAARHTPLPLFALGGVEAKNTGACLAAGAHGVSAIRSWIEGDPAAATRALHESVVAAT